MKSKLIAAMLFFASFSFAQTIEPELSKEEKKVKAVYYHENGKIMQEGYFENGKLEGTWISYNENGQKTSEGSYKEGKKVGNWLMYKDNQVSVIQFDQNKVIQISKNDRLANN